MWGSVSDPVHVWRSPLSMIDFAAWSSSARASTSACTPRSPRHPNINFAPYIKAPKLVVNGRHDEEHPWATRGLPLWNLLREPKELVLIDGVVHHPPAEQRVPPISAFLEKTLGPIVPR